MMPEDGWEIDTRRRKVKKKKADKKIRWNMSIDASMETLWRARAIRLEARKKKQAVSGRVLREVVYSC